MKIDDRLVGNLAASHDDNDKESITDGVVRLTKKYGWTEEEAKEVWEFTNQIRMDSVKRFYDNLLTAVDSAEQTKEGS